MIKVFKITIFITFFSILSSASNAETTKKDCSGMKKLHEKLLCKANKTTSSMESSSEKKDCSIHKSLHKKILCITNLKKK